MPAELADLGDGQVADGAPAGIAGGELPRRFLGGRDQLLRNPARAGRRASPAAWCRPRRARYARSRAAHRRAWRCDRGSWLAQKIVAPPRNSVCPSGALRATASAAMLPPAPGRFSITTGWPSSGAIRSASSRAVMSAAPPGGKGTTMLQGAGLGMARMRRRGRRARQQQPRGALIALGSTCSRDGDAFQPGHCRVALHHQRVVAGHDVLRARREPLQLVEAFQHVADMEGGGEGALGLHVLVEMGDVGGEHDRAARRLTPSRIAGPSNGRRRHAALMPGASSASPSWKTTRSAKVMRTMPATSSTSKEWRSFVVPHVAADGVVHLLLLQVEARLLEFVEAADMVVVQVADDDVLAPCRGRCRAASGCRSGSAGIRACAAPRPRR